MIFFLECFRQPLSFLIDAGTPQISSRFVVFSFESEVCYMCIDQLNIQSKIPRLLLRLLSPWLLNQHRTAVPVCIFTALIPNDGPTVVYILHASDFLKMLAIHLIIRLRLVMRSMSVCFTGTLIACHFWVARSAVLADFRHSVNINSWEWKLDSINQSENRKSCMDSSSRE
jgi:hypothetical protein